LFNDRFLSDIVEILCSVGVASCAATTEAPHGRESRRGRIPEERLVLCEAGTSDALFPAKVQSFLNFLMLVVHRTNQRLTLAQFCPIIPDWKSSGGKFASYVLRRDVLEAFFQRLRDNLA
jgi:hypothetical protein